MNTDTHAHRTRTPSRGIRGTDLRLPNKTTGKVRDIYPLPPGTAQEPAILLVATDRLSAFDVVLPTPLPDKGILLTEIAAFWLQMVQAAGICDTHLLSTDPALVPDAAFAGATTTRDDLRGRTMIGRRCRVIPVECVVRGYLEGSGWKDYQNTGTICGIPLPAGLRQCERLPAPIFTPATKAEHGEHDENISFETACESVGTPLMTRLRELSIAIYDMAARHAEARGIIIADTKFEFGIPVDHAGKPTTDQPILIDEALTPDSSRFWPADGYTPGRAQRSFDKQFVREHLETLVAAGKWDKTAPGPDLPAEVVEATLARYREARDRLTRP